MPIDGQNGGTSPESRDTGRPVEGTPAASVRPMPIWELETNIKEVILKTATNDEKGYAYLFADQSDEAGYFKVGKSATPLKRGKRHQSQCGHRTFTVIDGVPRGMSVPWHGRLESLALAELANMNYSYKCICGTRHREYCTGSWTEALEILNCWSRWLQLSPYDENAQLLPFWRDRLRLLGGERFSHPRCPRTECRDSDIGFSSCQKCLRLRLKAWTDVTDLDYFEYECRMRIGWGFHRQVMFLMWPLLGNSALTLIDGCERLKRLASFLWAPMTHLHLLLLLVLSLLLSSNASRASVLSYVISCIFAYCRIRSGLSYTPKAHTILQPPHKKATRRVSKSPALRIPLEAASEKEMPDTEEPPSEKRPVSRHRAHDISNTPRGQSAPGSPEMSDISEYNRPNPFLTPDRATRTVGKNSPKAGAKRRKSDVR